MGKITWTPERLEFLKQNYGKMSTRDMAKHLNTTAQSVSHRCSRLARECPQIFNRYNKYFTPRWADWQIEVLTEKWGILSFEEIGRIVHRSASAVKWKGKHMGLVLSDNSYNYVTLGEELGKSPTVVQKWGRKGWLKSRRSQFAINWGNVPMVILEEDIVAFLKKHYTLFNPSKINHPYFRNIVKDTYRKNHGMEYVGDVPKFTSRGHYPPLKLSLRF